MGLIDYIQDILGSNFRRTFANFRDDLDDFVKYSAKQIARHILREFAGISLIIISFLSFMIALVFFFIEYIGLSKTLSFLIIGIVVLLTGLIVRMIGERR